MTEDRLYNAADCAEALAAATAVAVFLLVVIAGRFSVAWFAGFAPWLILRTAVLIYEFRTDTDA